MSDLRTAAQQALEAYSLRDYEFGKYMEALRAALAEQPEQEPNEVKQIIAAAPRHVGFTFVRTNTDLRVETQVAPQPTKPAEQEPVAWIDITDEGQIVSSPRMYSDGSREERPLYTAPQPRRRLTDEEIAVIYLDTAEETYSGGSMARMRAFARAIERAHGIGEHE